VCDAEEHDTGLLIGDAVQQRHLALAWTAPAGEEVDDGRPIGSGVPRDEGGRLVPTPIGEDRIELGRQRDIDVTDAEPAVSRDPWLVRTRDRTEIDDGVTISPVPDSLISRVKGWMLAAPPPPEGTPDIERQIKADLLGIGGSDG
jgi:hypothetical protein